MKYYTAQSIKLQGKLERGNIHLYLVFHYGYKQQRLGPNGLLTTYHPLKVSTGQTVNPSNWQDGDFTATFRKRHGAVANQITAAVEDQRQKLFAAYTALMEKLEHLPSPEQIADLFRGNKVQAAKVRLTDFIRQHAASDHCPSDASRKKYRTLAQLIEVLEVAREDSPLRKHTQGRGTIYLHSFAEADWNDFAMMLRRATCYLTQAYERYGVKGLHFKEGKEQHSMYAMNTVEKYQKNLLTILHLARKQKLSLSVDLGLLEKVKYRREQKEHLNIHEINTLMTARLEGALDNVRRLFLLQLFCGVRVGDLKALLQKPIALVRGHERSFHAINIATTKTKTKVCIPLFDPALHILSHEKPTWVSEQRQNEHLKEICRQVGIDRIELVKIIRADGHADIQEVPLWTQVSTHTARRSAKTMLEGVPLYCSRHIVAAYQGHSVNDGAADNDYFCQTEEQYAEALLQQVAVNAHKLPFKMIPEAAVSVQRA